MHQKRPDSIVLVPGRSPRALRPSPALPQNVPPRPARSGPLCGVFAALLLAALSPREAGAVTFFNEITGISFPSPQPCRNPDTGAGEGCYTSWLVLSDIDGDGDMDILFANGGGYYVPGDAEWSTIYLNDGKAAFRDVTGTTFGGATSRLRQVSVGDVDGDGDLDIYQPGGYGLDLDKLWIQTSQGVFQDQAATRLPPGLKSRAGSSHLGDLDGDGDLDLIVGDWGNASTSSLSRLILYLNDGTGKFTRVAAQVEPELATENERFPTALPPQNAGQGQPPIYFGRRPIDIDLADVDGDFDLDILINHRDGQSRLFLNDGNAHFTDATNWAVIANEDGTYTVTADYPPKKGPYSYNQELCDIDGDGDLDLLIDNAGGRSTDPRGNLTQIAINDGTGVFMDETAERIIGEPPSDDNAVKCVDVNNDGHMDLIVASLQSDSEKLLLNDGSGVFDYIPDAFPAGKDPTLGIDVADLNGDGLFDVVTGQGEGNLRVNRIFLGMGGSMRDTRPPKFRAIQTPTPVPGEPIVFLMAVTDGVTSETGEHVKEVAVSYVNATGTGKVKAKFIGGDLFRVVIPPVPNGTQITLTPTATDRAGNTAKAPPMTFMVGTPDTGEGGSGGGSGDGGSDSGGAPSAGGMGADGGTAGGPTGQAGEPTMPEEPTGEAGSGGDSGVGGAAGTPSTDAGAPSRGGSPSSGGTPSSSGGTTPSGGAPAEAGAGGESDGSDRPRSKDDDDGGCSVALGPTGSGSGFGAVIALALASLLRRRRRSA